ncbi:MAG: type VI secretion protein IcmF/TssM N-terminal domain-containing protein [Desulfosalsimonas sp.]
MIGKILKFCFYLILAALFAAGLVLLVLFMQWPWWVGAALGAGILSLFFGILFLKRYLLQSRERRFVRQVIAQDAEVIGRVPANERRHLQELQDKWKRSVDLLRQSKLRNIGNPLYVLPWYLVMGESGSGKTTAIKNAKADSPVAEVSTGIAGTRNFDWWFFDEAIVLDTAGRYSIPIDQEPDREEWERFLALLSKYRKKEPLNGAVLAVAADDLLTGSADDLRGKGLNLRKRIDQLMRVCGAKFPVYIMVTKADRIHGFNQFSRLLPEDRLRQAMGSSNGETEGYWEDFLNSAHGVVCERLKDLRLLIIQHTSRPDPGVLMFPDEFEKLYSGLNAFAEGVFQENPYQETPMLAGVYYSSGMQQGGPCSEFVSNFNIACAAPANPRNGIFLTDFFKRILPGDRNLFYQIPEYFRWRRITRRFGLAAWCLLCLFFLGLISFSYMKNLEAIEKIVRNAENPPVFTDDASTDLLMLSAYGSRLEQIRQFNRDWGVPRFGLDQSLRVEEKFVDLYTASFRSHFIEPVDERLKKDINSFDESTPDEMIADHAAHIAARTMILEKYLKGANPSFSDMPASSSYDMLLVMDDEILDDIAAEFGRNYCRYLELVNDPEAVSAKIEEMKGLLARLLDSGGMNLGWLTARKMPDIDSIKMERYWGELENQGRRKSPAAVASAYTREGKANIAEFVDRIEQALGRSSGFDSAKADFWQHYEHDYLQTWADFAMNFSGVLDSELSPVARKGLARSMTTEENPYFALLSDMADQLRAVENLPDWAALILEIEEIRNTRTESEDGKASFLDRVRDKGSDAVGKTLSVTSPEAAKKRQTRLEAAEKWEKFLESLADLQPVEKREETAYKKAKDFFSRSGEGSGDNSEFFAARDDLSSLLALLNKNGDTLVAEELLEGPLNYLAEFAVSQAGSVIQKEWEETVLAETRGMDPLKVSYAVFNRQDGSVWKFLDGPAESFIKRGKDGFYAASAMGQSVDFRREFFSFLDQGAEGTVDLKSSYPVTISALPVQVNKGAEAKPYGVILNLACAEGQTRLENYNFPETREFKWEMNQCGDVELTILLPDTRLDYEYEGEMGFALFLRDFRDGVKIFTPEDFPGQTGLLKDKGVSRIRVAYEIEGAGPVVSLLKDVPGEIPEIIVSER